MFHDMEESYNRLKDYGPEPYVTDVACAAMKNTFYRRALWTGSKLQMTLMQIDAGDDIGLEVHPDVDQFIMVICGCGVTTLGKSRDALTCKTPVKSGYGVFVPAGTWHNLINCGGTPMKIFTIYAPPEHAPGTVHPTKEIAAEEEHG